MRSLSFIVAPLVVTFALCQVASADFRCESRVGYTVELSPPRAQPPAPDSKITPAVAGTSDPKETTIYLQIAEARGENEAKAKAALQKASTRQLEKMREECRERHENIGGCIGSKYEKSAAVLRTLGFAARKALEEALQSDCEAQRGRCKKVEATEPVCAEIVVPGAVTPAEGDGKDAGKDDKKKAKK